MNNLPDLMRTCDPHDTDAVIKALNASAAEIERLEREFLEDAAKAPGRCPSCDTDNCNHFSWCESGDRLAGGTPEKASKTKLIEDIIRDVCELPHYSSPDDQPELLQCTVSELSAILENRLTVETASQVSKASPLPNWSWEGLNVWEASELRRPDRMMSPEDGEIPVVVLEDLQQTWNDMSRLNDNCEHGLPRRFCTAAHETAWMCRGCGQLNFNDARTCGRCEDL